jgi:hypothetical protein
MKKNEYMKAVIQKLQCDNTITCEDCGAADRMSHVIVDHHFGTVKTVCHSCFVNRYQAGIYGPEFKA